MQIFSHLRLNPAGRTDVVGGPHAARGPQVAQDCYREWRTTGETFFALACVVFQKHRFLCHKRNVERNVKYKMHFALFVWKIEVGLVPNL